MATMHLRIRTPTRTLVERSVESLTAEDQTGRFGVRPGIEPLLTLLVPSIITYRHNEEMTYVAVDRGLLFADRNNVHITVRQGMVGTSLDSIEEELVQVKAATRSSEVAARRAFRALFNHLQHTLLEEGRTP